MKKSQFGVCFRENHLQKGKIMSLPPLDLGQVAQTIPCPPTPARDGLTDYFDYAGGKWIRVPKVSPQYRARCSAVQALAASVFNSESVSQKGGASEPGSLNRKK